MRWVIIFSAQPPVTWTLLEMKCGVKAERSHVKLHVELPLAGSQAVQRPVTFLIAEEGSAGGVADTKTREDASSCNVISLFMISSVTLEWLTSGSLGIPSTRTTATAPKKDAKEWRRGGRTGRTLNPAKAARV